MDKGATFIVRGLIRVYQLMTAGRPRRCRFAPSCSEYMREALAEKGFWRGFGQGIRRLLRCHPWHPGGWDPVETLEHRPSKRAAIQDFGHPERPRNVFLIKNSN